MGKGVVAMKSNRLGDLKEENRVRILTDVSCSMKAVYVNDLKVMEGNYHDFYNGCHGYYDIPNFSSARGLAEVLMREIKRRGKKVELTFENYTFDW